MARLFGFRNIFPIGVPATQSSALRFCHQGNIIFRLEKVLAMMITIVFALVALVLVGIVVAFMVRATWGYLLPGLLLLAIIFWLLFGA